MSCVIVLRSQPLRAWPPLTHCAQIHVVRTASLEPAALQLADHERDVFAGEPLPAIVVRVLDEQNQPSPKTSSTRLSFSSTNTELAQMIQRGGVNVTYDAEHDGSAFPAALAR